MSRRAKVRPLKISSTTSYRTKRPMFSVEGLATETDYENWGFTEESAQRIAQLPVLEHRVSVLETENIELRNQVDTLLAQLQRKATLLDDALHSRDAAWDEVAELRRKFDLEE